MHASLLGLNSSVRPAAYCEDGYADCFIYKPYCKHDDYKDFVSEYCKKTCDLCPKGNFLILLL